MDHLKSKSPAMVDGALAVYRCAHNRVRALMLEAAVRAEVPLRRLSLKGSCGALLKALNGPQSPERKTPGGWEILLEMAAGDLLPARPNRREPRAAKRRPKNYQRLTAPRSSFQEVQHRHRAKKPLIQAPFGTDKSSKIPGVDAKAPGRGGLFENHGM